MTKKDEAREAAVKLLSKKVNLTWTGNSGYKDGFRAGFNDGYDFAKSENRWNVIERDGLPKEEHMYLVTYKDGGVGATLIYSDEEDDDYFAETYPQGLDYWIGGTNSR